MWWNLDETAPELWDPAIYGDAITDWEKEIIINARRPDFQSCTMGHEVEQVDEKIKRTMHNVVTKSRLSSEDAEYRFRIFLTHTMEVRGGDYDGSGPWEWSFGPYDTGIQGAKVFLKDVWGTLGEHVAWEWHNEAYVPSRGRVRGCGSHLHFRPIDEWWRKFADTHFGGDILWGKALAFTLLWNTLIDTAFALLPFFCWGDRFRKEAGYCAAPFHIPDRAMNLPSRWRSRRLKVSTVKQFTDDERRTDYRRYLFITFNNGLHHGHFHPLTVELRVNECPPTISCVGQQILCRLVLFAFKTQLNKPPNAVSSPKLARESVEVVQDFLDEVLGAHRYGGRPRPLFDKMLEFGPIVYENGCIAPGNFPYIKPRFRYDNVFHLFYEIVKNVFNPVPRRDRKKYWVCRVIWLLVHRVPPEEEADNVWLVLERDFNWDNAPMPDEPVLPKSYRELV